MTCNDDDAVRRKRAVFKVGSDLSSLGYLAAVRTLKHYEGYNHLNEITSDYDRIISERNERLEKERTESERIAAERQLDKESRIREKKLRK